MTQVEWLACFDFGMTIERTIVLTRQRLSLSEKMRSMATPEYLRTTSTFSGFCLKLEWQ